MHSSQQDKNLNLLLLVTLVTITDLTVGCWHGNWSSGDAQGGNNIGWAPQ